MGRRKKVTETEAAKPTAEVKPKPDMKAAAKKAWITRRANLAKSQVATS